MCGSVGGGRIITCTSGGEDIDLGWL